MNIKMESDRIINSIVIIVNDDSSVVKVKKNE